MRTPSTGRSQPMDATSERFRSSGSPDWRGMLRASVPVAAGLGAILLGWWAAAEIFASLRVIPEPFAVLRQMLADRGAYAANAATTLREAFVGFCWGNAVAVALGCLFVQFPLVERSLLRVAVASYCIPLVTIG